MGGGRDRADERREAEKGRCGVGETHRQKAAGKGVETESYIVEIKASSPKS